MDLSGQRKDQSGCGFSRAYRKFRALGLVTFWVFLFFVLLLIYVLNNAPVHTAGIFALFLAGLLWLGMTSLTRHAYVLALQMAGVQASLPEFLMTQFIAVLFPLYDRRLKNHAKNGCTG